MIGKNTQEIRENLRAYAASDPPATYAEALGKAVAEIERRKAREKNKDVFSQTRRYILFVPDKYTLTAERLLYGGNVGAFDVEVLTLNRLCGKIAERGGTPTEPLSRLGAVLTVRRIVGEIAGELDCFARSVQYPGFAETMYDNICQIAASGLSADDLPDGVGGIAGKKLQNIKKVYAAYEQATRGKYVDASGKLRLLLQSDEALRAFFADTDVFFACYDEFTPLQRRVVGKICSLCGKDHAQIYDATCALSLSGKKIEVYAAPTRADELKAAAVRIRALHERGVAYGEMGVVATKRDLGRLKRIFAEYGIALFADEKYALSSHPLARYLLDLFACAQSGSNENYIRLSKSPYCGLTTDETDRFENYVRGTALGEGSMARAFTFEPNDPVLRGTCKDAEKVRALLYKRVRAVRREAQSGQEFCRTIEKAIPENEAKIGARFSTPFDGARGEIAAQAQVIAEVFPRPVPFAVLLQALQECFSLKEVGVIPNRANAVEAGDVSVFRAGGKKYLFVPSMHEGELPNVLRDDGLLSDRDLETVAAETEGRAKIEPSVQARNRRAEAELRAVLSASESLFLSYCEGSVPSPVLEEIERRYRVKHSSYADERVRLAGIDDRGARRAQNRDAALLRALCPTPAAALELYLAGERAAQEGGERMGFENELRLSLADRVPHVRAHGDRVPSAAALYPESGISVSRVQEYFTCPLRCFLRYGLRLRPRPTGEVTPVDLGTFLHRVIELFAQGDPTVDPAVAIPALVETVRREQPQLLRGASDGFVAELTEEATALARVAAEQLRKGKFSVRFTEAEFGEGALLRGIEVYLPHGILTAEGKIDRLDVADDGAKGIARVIDYKTGRVGFSFDDVYQGCKIQLPLYLKVAQNNGFTPAGMFYFPFSDGFAREKSHRLVGVFDTAYAGEMDEELTSPQYVSDVVPAKSTKDSCRTRPVLAKSDACLDGETLRAVCDYATAVFAQGAKEMYGGYVAASPRADGRSVACAYCDAKAVCAAMGNKPRPRKKRRMTAQGLQTIVARAEAAATADEKEGADE